MKIKYTKSYRYRDAIAVSFKTKNIKVIFYPKLENIEFWSYTAFKRLRMHKNGRMDILKI